MSDYMNYQAGVQCSADMVADASEWIADHYTKKINDTLDKVITQTYQNEINYLEKQGKSNLQSLENDLSNALARKNELTKPEEKFIARPESKYFRSDDPSKHETVSVKTQNVYTSTLPAIEACHYNVGLGLDSQKYAPNNSSAIRPNNETIRKMIDVENQIHTVSVQNYTDFGGYDSNGKENPVNIADLVKNSYEYQENNGCSYFYRIDPNRQNMSDDMGNISYSDKKIFIETSEGVFEYKNFGFKTDDNGDYGYSRGTWELVADNSHVTYDKKYNQRPLSADQKKELKDLNDKITSLQSLIATQKQNISDIRNGNEMRLSFSNRRDLQKFVFDMQNQGINVAVIANKINDQYCVVTSDVYKTQITNYGQSQNMEIRQYQMADLNGTDGKKMASDFGNSFMNPFMMGVYSTEAGQTQRNIHRAFSYADNVKRFEAVLNAPTTQQLRHEAWGDLESAVRDINSGRTPATDIKYANTWKPDKTKSQFMDTKTMLGEIDKTYGSSLGVRLLSSKNLTADAIKVRKEILKKYSGTIKVDRKGQIDMKTVRELQSGKVILASGNKPTEAELNFLLMTAQGADKSGFGEALKSVSGTIGMNIAFRSDCGILRDGMKVVQRSKQIIRITKSVDRLAVKNTKAKIQAVRLKKAEKNPVKAAQKSQAKIAKKSVKKPSSHPKRAGSNSLIQKHRINKMARKDKRKERRQAFWENSVLGRINKLRKDFNAKIGGVLDRFNFIKKQRERIGNRLIGKGNKELGEAIKEKGVIRGVLGAVKKKLILVAGIVVGGLICVVAFTMLITGAVSVISSFFGEPEVESTIIYKLYERLQEEENDWMEKGTNPETLFKRKADLKYGSIEDGNFMSLDEYCEYLTEKGISGENGKATIYTIGSGDGVSLYINPFNFPLDDDMAKDQLKQIEAYDGTDNEWLITPYGTSDHTENIKDILCMTDVMFQFDTDGASDDILHQSMSDSWIAFEFKDFCNDARNLFKRIGAWFSGEDYNEDKELETVDYSVVKGYVTSLFDASHQESVELIPVVLPTLNEGDYNDLVEKDDTHTLNMYCPKPYGCQELTKLTCRSNGSEDYNELRDVNGQLHRLYGVHFTNESDRCVSSSFRGDAGTFGKVDSSRCWVKNVGDTQVERVGEAPVGLENYSETTVSSTTPAITYDYDYFVDTTFKRTITVKYTETHNYTYTTTEEYMVYHDKYTEICYREVSHTGSYQIQVTEVTVETYKHECREDHKGTLCGGHVSVKVNGYVFSFPAYLCEEEAEATEDDSRVEPVNASLDFVSAMQRSGENLWVADDGTWASDRKRFSSVSNFEGRIMLCDDIFDVALLLRYGKNIFPIHNNWKNYESWSADNISLAIMKYNADWEDMYRFDIESNYGMSKLTATDKALIIEALKTHYGEMSEDRIRAIDLVLSAVGNGSYNMKHHAHAYTMETCQITGHMCKTTDCSGFCSYVYMYFDKLDECYATDGLSRGCPIFTSWDDLMPADMLIHYSGQTSSEAQTNGGAGSHALIFLGFVDYPIELSNGTTIQPDNPVTVDCLSFYSYHTITDYKNDYDCGAGNIYLRHTGGDSFGHAVYIDTPDEKLFVRKFE